MTPESDGADRIALGNSLQWCGGFYRRAGLFVIDSHSKKRPHNLIFGRMFDHRLYDMLELGVENVRSIKSFGKAGVSVQAGNKVSLSL